MSIDCEEFFESIGIKTDLVRGKNNHTAHMWCELDFGFFKLPFESTSLFFYPSHIDYRDIKISEGFIDGDDIYTNESYLDLEWINVQR